MAWAPTTAPTDELPTVVDMVRQGSTAQAVGRPLGDWGKPDYTLILSAEPKIQDNWSDKEEFQSQEAWDWLQRHAIQEYWSSLLKTPHAPAKIAPTMSHAVRKTIRVLEEYKDTVDLMQTSSGKFRYYLRENGVTMRTIRRFTEAGFTDEEIARSLGNLTVEQIHVARSFLDDMV